jgi:hypothetical protein
VSGEPGCPEYLLHKEGSPVPWYRNFTGLKYNYIYMLILRTYDCITLPGKNGLSKLA